MSTRRALRVFPLYRVSVHPVGPVGPVGLGKVVGRAVVGSGGTRFVGILNRRLRDQARIGAVRAEPRITRVIA
jgi:hypothetical protein